MLSPTKHTRDLSGNLFIYLPPNAVYVSYVPIVSQKGAAVNVFCVDAANALVSNRSVEIFTRQTQAVFPNFSVLADNVLVF